MIFAVCYAIYMDWRSEKLESQLDARQEAVYGELLEGMDSLESKLYKPVSYTHLDVYKRQSGTFSP